MALIDKETIRAEIERRKNTAETMRERGAYIDLLDFLDSLPEQKETAEDDYCEEVFLCGKHFG